MTAPSREARPLTLVIGSVWLAVTLVMIVPVVLLSIAISKLPSPHETAATDSH